MLGLCRPCSFKYLSADTYWAPTVCKALFKYLRCQWLKETKTHDLVRSSTILDLNILELLWHVFPHRKQSKKSGAPVKRMQALEVKRLGSIIIVAPVLIPGVTFSSFSPFTPQFPICKMGINSSFRIMLFAQDLVKKGWILSKSLFLILEPMASSATSGSWSASSRGKELL